MVIWSITALIGFYMFGVSLGIGRAVGQPSSTHWPSWLVFLHPTLAVVGLAVWIVYMNYPEQALAWAALVDLLLVATLGDVLLVTWLKDRRAELRAGPDGVKQVKNYVPRPQQGRVQAPAPETVPVTALEERRIPLVAVLTHGVLAVVTILLVLLFAVGVLD
jgi:hypothetical protein